MDTSFVLVVALFGSTASAPPPIRSFEDTDANDHNYDKKIADHLQSIVYIGQRLLDSDSAIRIKLIDREE